MTDFPMDTIIFNKIVEVFNQTRSYVLLLFPLAFFIRIAFGFIFLKPQSFTDILKDSLFLFLGLFFFTDILKMALQIPYFVSSELALGEWRNINRGEGLFTKALKRIVDWIGILSYWISFGLYVVIVSMLGFFAGYILFLGTMFRAYGLLKVFFILLFTVSLWPLLWHSINFAVFTIAVSDNAMANNVIIGGASLAKVFIPIWLISKTSKIPIAESLKKVSLKGGGLAYSGGGYVSSVNNTSHTSKRTQNKQNIINEGAEISLQDTVFQETTDYTKEPEDFSLRERESVFLPSEENIKPDNALTFNKEEQKSVSANLESHVEDKVLKESHIQNDINKEVHVENNSQITNEITQSQNISQNHNESVLSETSKETLKYEGTITEQNSQMFNEAIHRVDWIEEGKNINRPPQKEKTKEDDRL